MAVVCNSGFTYLLSYYTLVKWAWSGRLRGWAASVQSLSGLVTSRSYWLVERLRVSSAPSFDRVFVQRPSVSVYRPSIIRHRRHISSSSQKELFTRLINVRALPPPAPAPPPAVEAPLDRCGARGPCKHSGPALPATHHVATTSCAGVQRRRSVAGCCDTTTLTWSTWSTGTQTDCCL